MSTKSWKDEDFIEFVKTSNTLTEVSKKLGLSNFGANSKTIKKYIKILNLDTSHFLSKEAILKSARAKINKMSDEDLFSINSIDRKYIKKRILTNNLIPYVCQRCGINSWDGEKLSLHLDHINGVNNDNNISNLRFLCPNCHSLTESYCGKQLKKIISNQSNCLDCNKSIHRSSQRCRACSAKRRNKTKIVWPSYIELQLLINELGYSGTGRKLGISNSAVKKHFMNHKPK